MQILNSITYVYQNCFLMLMFFFSFILVIAKMTTSPLRFFDLLETGTCGRVEVIPEQIRTPDDIPLPLTTVRNILKSFCL